MELEQHKEFLEFKEISDLFFRGNLIIENDLILLNGYSRTLYNQIDNDEFKYLMDILLAQYFQKTKYDSIYSKEEDSVNLVNVFYGGFFRDDISSFPKYKEYYIQGINLEYNGEIIRQMLENGQYDVYYLKLHEALHYIKKAFELSLVKLYSCIEPRYCDKVIVRSLMNSIKVLEKEQLKIKDKVSKVKKAINKIEEFWLDYC